MPRLEAHLLVYHIVAEWIGFVSIRSDQGRSSRFAPADRIGRENNCSTGLLVGWRSWAHCIPISVGPHG